MPQDTHVCPVGNCTLQVGQDMLMCPVHWRQVPGAIQRAVTAAWRGGAGEGSLAHHSAITAAVRAVESLTSRSERPRPGEGRGLFTCQATIGHRTKWVI